MMTNHHVGNFKHLMVQINYWKQFLRDGKRGYGILVSSVPKESNAFYSLRDPLEV